jgi:cell division protein FtsX
MGRAWCGALLVVAVLTACTDDGPECSDAQRLRPDVEIFMRLDATAADMAGVRQQIRQTRGVRRSAFVSHEESFRLLREVLAESALEGEGPEDAPESFRFELEEAQHRRRLVAPFERLDGVGWVATRPTPAELKRLRRKLARLRDQPEVEVFMNVAATPEQTAAVRAAIEQSPRVQQLEFMSRDDAYREFQRLFADQPDLVATTSPEALPESFRVDIDDTSKSERFARTLENLPGIDEVKTSHVELQIYENGARFADLREVDVCRD